MRINLPILIQTLLIVAKLDTGEAEVQWDGRGLRGVRETTAVKCARVGQQCKKNAACCSGRCISGVCKKKKPANQCVVPDQGQCNGAGHKGCKTCLKGSGCVYSKKELSVCLPGYNRVSDTCVVPDGSQCGGEGYAGCQTCKVGSQCVELNPFKSVCYAGGKVPDEAAPMIDDNDLMDVGSWVLGIDPVLDEEIHTMERRRLQGSNATNATSVDFDEMRQRISKAFASDDGLQKAQELMKTSKSFQKFNNKSAAELQETFCSTFQSSSSLVSVEVKNCICGNTDKPFVYCAALLEQELNHHMETRRTRKDRRELSAFQSRQLPSCSINLEGVGKDAKFTKYASAVSNQLSDMSPTGSEEGAGDLCLGGECSVPLAPLPFDAVAGVEGCIPTLGLLKADVNEITALDARRAAASKMSASIFAKICLTGAQELEKASNILEFLGLDLCPIQFKGTIRPLTGVLEGELTAAVLMMYVKGSLQLQYETETRNSLKLCDGAQCGDGENADCAMCAGNMYAKVEIGIKFLFASFSQTIAQTDVIEQCTSTDSANGQCISGLGKSDNTKWEDGKICGLGTTCNNCANTASYWDSKAFTACGTEPCWTDGTICGAGTTCKNCCNEARNALGTQCGGEKWKDGTLCGQGTTCNFCKNKATFWESKLFTACGSEPCWKDGTVCGAGTTCKKCCNEARNALGTQCGGSKWTDGTSCGYGTTCNFCENKATYWDSKAFTACGTEPCWTDGTVCGAGTTCNKCCNEARDALGTKCGGSKWSDGTQCGLGTTCNLCANPASWWDSKFFTACGSEPKWGDGTVCALGSTCNKCANSATYWSSQAFTACGSEPCWGGGTRCAAGTSCNKCCRGSSWSWDKFGDFCN